MLLLLMDLSIIVCLLDVYVIGRNAGRTGQ